MKPLQGVKVVDLSRVLAGPYCTSMLADLGAEVIKVETSHGDDSRHIGPFINDESVYFAILNRGKKSISLNLKDAVDRQRFYDLCDDADVVVENFRPGVTQRLGIDEGTLRKQNPGLVYCSISGFGQDGAMAGKPAYDIIAQALSGIMSTTGPEGGPPTRVGESIGDLCTGQFASWSICAALFQRERDPEWCGTYLDVAMVDCLFSMQITGLSQLAADGVAPGPLGNRHPLSAPFDTFQAQDGKVIIAVANNNLFAKLSNCMNIPSLATDGRFLNDEGRYAHQAELKALIERWTASQTVKTICARLDNVGVPASPIRDIKQAAESPHARDRQLLIDAGHFKYPTQPVRFDGNKVFTEQPAPTLNQHADLA